MEPNDKVRITSRPVPASELLDLELKRKEILERRGRVLTGCGEIDGHVLLGGLERGTIVGVSCEEEDMGLLIGLQTVSHLLATRCGDGSSPRAMIITTLSTSLLLPKLREVLVAQIAVLEGGMRDVQGVLRVCFENISIARVFDFEGLWEVLAELEAAASAVIPERVEVEVSEEVIPKGGVVLRSEPPGEKKSSTKRVPAAEREQSGEREPTLERDLLGEGKPTAEGEPELAPSPRTKRERTEILDSEEEADGVVALPSSSSPLSSPPSSLPDVWDPDWEPRGKRNPKHGSGEPRGRSSEAAATRHRTRLESEPGLGQLENSVEAESGLQHGRQTEPQSEQRSESRPHARRIHKSETKPPPERGHESEPPKIPPRLTEREPVQENSDGTRPSSLPDLIIITHTSTLLNTVFTGDKPTAHNRMLLLSSKLRHLTRSPTHGNPLIMLLNSTASVISETPVTDDGRVPPPRPPREGDAEQTRNHPEPTLRSIFTYSPVLRRGVSRTQHSRPSFGLVFAQLLDLHLLCTRVPRTKTGDRGWVWVVEVLLDEVGVCEVREKEGEAVARRRSREQRWAAVDVEDVGRRVVGAFR